MRKIQVSWMAWVMAAAVAGTANAQIVRPGRIAADLEQTASHTGQRVIVTYRPELGPSDVAGLASPTARIRARLDGIGAVAMRVTADDVARAVLFAMDQPPHVDVNEILIRPTVQDF